ncbi:hypothetical protein RMATCC62417_05792 [Rhizopus microsporus]|nr:hypothetical protein RMATCC62417_05792 [Rhizopus microsporus]
MKRKQKNRRKQVKKRQNKIAAYENEEFKDIFKINQALSMKDYGLLREIGRQSGFVSDPVRRRVWPFLLHYSERKVKREGSLNIPHKDEEQVKLDVTRSFNAYPKNVDDQEKEKLQGQLHRVIIHVLRSYPSLHYYQGFHDICSVFLLLFGEKYACQLMERVALFYLRDAMFATLEPVMKQLTMIDSLIRLEDNELYEFIMEAGVLPYYALSWVITWYSHDLSDLEKIARLFDLILSSNPLMPVYVAAATVISKRKQVLALPCDTSTVHSFLTNLASDTDIDAVCEQAHVLEARYGVHELQSLSTIPLDQFSVVNRFEQDYLSIDTLEKYSEKVSEVIRITRQEKYDKPIELAAIKPHEATQSMLNKLLMHKEMYTVFTVGASLSILAFWIANSGLIREWMI